MSLFKKKKVLIPSVLVLLLIIIYFVARNILFNYAINKVKAKLESYNLHFNYEKAEPIGFKGAFFKKICLETENKDTLFFSDSIYLNLKFTKLLTGNLGLSQIYFKNTFARIDKSIFEFKRQEPVDSTKIIKSGYDAKLRKIFGMFFSYVPTMLNIDNFKIQYRHDPYWANVSIPDFKIFRKNIEGYFVCTDSIGASLCNIKGNYDPAHEKFNFILSGENGNSFKVPYLAQRINTKAQFDSLKVHFSILSDDDDVLKFIGKMQVYDFVVDNKKVGPKPVKTDFGSLEFQLAAGQNFIELDSSSQAILNKFAVSTYFRYEKDRHRMVSLKIPQQEFLASNLFESLPEGLFFSIRDMKVKGNLQYSLDFFIDLDQPDSVKFSSIMQSKGFKIERFGNANLYMMNDTFTHVAFNPDGSAKTIYSAAFTPLNEISPFLRYSVLTSEDGSFFGHRGFNEEAIANSISTNFKEKRFKRGGSTISMQLVKNLFLTRNKTISRKLEEIFIVWMIENLHLTSKERMYEVYLNIIEWGPNVYGVKEAAKFYFNKKPSELNLRESIFLASIIPSPRGFKYSFEEDGSLKSSLNAYYKNVAGIMVRRNQISEIDTLQLLSGVKLAKNAMKIVVPESDSDEEEGFFNWFKTK